MDGPSRKTASGRRRHAGNGEKDVDVDMMSLSPGGDGSVLSAFPSRFANAKHRRRAAAKHRGAVNARLKETGVIAVDKVGIDVDKSV